MRAEYYIKRYGKKVPRAIRVKDHRSIVFCGTVSAAFFGDTTGLTVAELEVDFADGQTAIRDVHPVAARRRIC
jgi:CO/xanthine dehydrogenase Mo-binding subunit